MAAASNATVARNATAPQLKKPPTGPQMLTLQTLLEFDSSDLLDTFVGFRETNSGNFFA